MKANLLLIATTTLLSQLSFELPCTALPCTTVPGLSLIRCETTEKDASTSQIKQTAINQQIKQPLTKEVADAVMTKVVDAINRGDASLLAQYLDRGDQGFEFATAALADYKYYFKGQKVVRFKIDKTEVNSRENLFFSRNVFSYKIFSSTGISSEIAVYRKGTAPTVNTIGVTSEFLDYSVRVKEFLKYFIKYIQQNNPQKLASVLTPDDIDYPVVKAKKVILNYKEKFDVNTLKYRFHGLEYRTGLFLYTIYGFKGEKAIEHKVKVGHGDGMIGLDDKLIPLLDE